MDSIEIWQPQNLSTNQVSLLPLVDTDFDALYKVASDPLIWEQHPSPDRYKKTAFQKFFDDALASQTAFKVLVDGQMAGSTRFYDLSETSVAIGFTFLAREHWGGIVNGQMKALMLNYAFGFVERVYLHIGATNFRSQKAAEKLGAKLVREFERPSESGPMPYREYIIQKSPIQN